MTDIITADKPRVRVRAGSRALAPLSHASPDGGATLPYRAASLGTQETFAWRPPPTSADSAVLPSRDLASRRVRDLVRNEPHAAAGVSRLVDMIVGARLRLSAKPDGRALGIDTSTAEGRAEMRALGERMESEMRMFAEDPRRFCDAQRRLSLNGLWRQLGRTWCTLGESAAFLSWKPEKGARYATCLRTIDPDRLSNPNGVGDTKNLRGGIEFDDDGVPLAYHVRNGHPADRFADLRSFTWTRIPRATAWGRPIFIHGFEAEREDQARAMTPFAALMTRLRMVGKFADTELASATVNALFAAFVKSNLPVAEATQSMTPTTLSFADRRIEYYRDNPPTLNGVRIPVMPIGDEIQLNAATRNTTAFPAFQTAFLQSVAAGLGISYEQLAMDWSRVNYSSARAALNEVWRHVQLMLAVFIEQVVCPVHYAVMEEAFDRGYIVPPKGAPEFYDMPGAYLSARWIGPGRGYVDPTKEAEAASMGMDSLTSTLEAECAEQGRDLEEVLDQIAIENEMLAERRLSRKSVAASKGAAGGTAREQDGPSNEATT